MKYIYRLAYVVVTIIVVSVFTRIICDSFRKEPNFSELKVTSGILKRIGDLDGGRRSRHLPVWVVVNGAEIKIKLPTTISKDKLTNNVGKEIKVYTQKIWLGSDKVWHVTGNGKVYYEYNERLARTKTIKPFFIVIEIFLSLFLVLYIYFQRTNIKKAWNGNTK